MVSLTTAVKSCYFSPFKVFDISKPVLVQTLHKSVFCLGDFCLNSCVLLLLHLIWVGRGSLASSAGCKNSLPISNRTEGGERGVNERASWMPGKYVIRISSWKIIVSPVLPVFGIRNVTRPQGEDFMESCWIHSLNVLFHGIA